MITTGDSGADEAIESLRAFTVDLETELSKHLGESESEGKVPNLGRGAQEEERGVSNIEDSWGHKLDDDVQIKNEGSSLSSHASIFASPHKSFRIISESVEDGDSGEEQDQEQETTKKTMKTVKIGGGNESKGKEMSKSVQVSSSTSPQDALIQQLRSRLSKEVESEPELETETEIVLKQESQLQSTMSSQDMLFQQLKARAGATSDSTSEELKVNTQVTHENTVPSTTAANDGNSNTLVETPPTPTSPSVPGARVIPNAMNIEAQITSNSLKKNWLESYDREDDNDDEEEEEKDHDEDEQKQREILSFTPFSGNVNTIETGTDNNDSSDNSGNDSNDNNDNNYDDSNNDDNNDSKSKSKDDKISNNDDNSSTDNSMKVDSSSSPIKQSVPQSKSEPLRAQNSAISDDRVQGDYSAWQTGARLNPKHLKNIYSGLVDTAAEDNKFSINLTIECLLRPDISPAVVLDLMTKVAKTSRMQKPGDAKQAPLRFTRRCDSHLIIEASYENIETAAGSSQENNDNDVGDWDLIDVQICVSRQLRQRVMLCQFMKQNFHTNHDNDLSKIEKEISLSTGDAYIESTSATAFLSENSGLSPATRRMTRVMQRLLTQSKLSFSCLFLVEASSVLNMEGPEGLDIQYSKQLEMMYKENMAQSMKVFFEDIEEKTQRIVQETDLLKSLMSPIFKQHGLDLEVVQSDIQYENYKQENREIGINDDMVTNDDTHEPNSNDSSNSLHNVSNDNDNDNDNNDESIDNMVYNVQNVSRLTMQGKLWFQEYDDERQKSYEEGEHGDHESSTSIVQDINGLTKCISALDKLSDYLQDKCSLKSKELQLRKSDETMMTIKAVSKYRKRMLRVLTNSDEAQNSTLTKAFVDTFKAVAVVGTRNTESECSNDEDNNDKNNITNNQQALYIHITTHFPMTEGVSANIIKQSTHKNANDYSTSDNNNNNNNDVSQLELSSTTDVQEDTKDQQSNSSSSDKYKDGDTSNNDNDNDNDDNNEKMNDEMSISSLSTERKDNENGSSGGFFSWVYNAVTEPEPRKTRPKPNNLKPTKYEILRNTQLISPHLVVICYGRCFIESTPATMYITSQYFCLSIGFPGFTFMTKKIYPISKLVSVKVMQGSQQDSLDNTKGDNQQDVSSSSTSSSLAFSVLPNAIKPSSLVLSFVCNTAGKSQQEEVIITPAVLDCYRLRILITELKEMELHEYTPVNSDFVSAD